MDKIFKNNQVILSGKIVSDFEFNHEVFGEKFYIAEIEIKRQSGQTDTLLIMVSDRLVDTKMYWIGQNVKVCGNFRSYNKYENGKTHLKLSVFAREIDFAENIEESSKTNQIYLDGCICKEPIYRKTPLGREIADVLLAVNRPYSKSDYIPCICWGRNARFVSNLEIGTHIKADGRIQSREYQKRISEDEYEIRTAYEVSISRLEVAEDGQSED